MREILKGSTSVTQEVVLRDSTTGLGKTGLIHSDITGSYTRNRDVRTAVTMATLAAANSAWSSGGFKEIDATNCPGLYRFDVPDAALATGVRTVTISLKATGVITEHLQFILTGWDPQDAVRGGLTALPNAAAEAAGGLFTRGTGAGQINQAANGMVDTNPVRLNNVAQSLLDLKDFADDGYDPSTNKVQGVVLTDTVTTYTDNTPQTGDAFARVGAAGAGLTAVPWNAAWDAEVQSEVADALAVYDPPTHTELIAEIDAVQADVAALNDLSAAQVNAEVDTAIADARLDELLAADSDIDGAAPPAVGSVIHELLTMTAGSFTYDQTTDSLEAIRDRGDAAWTTGAGGSAPTVEEIRQEMDSNSTQLAAIVADTNELETDWSDGGRLDVILDARASQASVDDLPTNAELATSQAAADDATLAAIAALNNLTAAQVVAALKATTFAECAQGAPADSPTLEYMLMLPYMRLINGYTSDSDSEEVRNGAGTVIAKRTLSDAAGTFTAAKMVSGP